MTVARDVRASLRADLQLYKLAVLPCVDRGRWLASLGVSCDVVSMNTASLPLPLSVPRFLSLRIGIHYSNYLTIRISGSFISYR